MSSVTAGPPVGTPEHVESICLSIINATHGFQLKQLAHKFLEWFHLHFKLRNGSWDMASWHNTQSFHPWLLSQLKDILEGVQTNSGLTVQELTQAFDEIKSTLASKLFTRWSSQFGSRRALSPYQLNDDCVAQLVSFGPIVAGFVTQALTDQRRRKVLDKLDEAEVLIRRQQLKLGDIVRIRAEVEALLSHAPHQHSMGRRAYLAYPDVARRSRF